MKTMRLFCGILIGLMIFSSCSNDDDNDINQNTNLIIGTWKPIKEVDVCSTGSEEIFDFDNCTQQSRYVFTSHDNPGLETDGTIMITERNLENGECATIYTGLGTWSLNGDNFVITTDGETNNPTFFELTSNRLRIGYYDDEPNNTCDGGNLPSHYYTELVRVE